MITVNVRKLRPFRIKGKPSPALEELKRPLTVAALPERIPGIRPRLNVKTGDAVKTGDLLFHDKTDERLHFLSPGTGEVEFINLGHRRVIKEIVIRLAKEDSYVEFERVDERGLKSLGREKIIELMMKAGVWPYIRSLPYRGIADPDRKPRYLYVPVEDHEPFQPRAEVYLDQQMKLFKFGLTVLERLADHLIVCSDYRSGFVQDHLRDLVTHRYTGEYPACDPGVIQYRTKTSAKDHSAWFVNAQDVLQVARLFRNGRYPVERIVTLAGDLAPEGKHFKTRLGVPLEQIVRGRIRADSLPRYITGGLFRGYKSEKDSHMGFYETALNVFSEEEKEEVFGYVQAGYHKPSYSKTFLSRFNRSELIYDCRMHGEERACINCGYCDKVCPVDILPQFTLKALVADEVEEALAHGMLDCVECGLCTYVCPSKIELRDTFRQAKTDYQKELE